MDFPIFQSPYLGNGMTIALDAVLHVFISHGIAIGLVAMIAIGEYLGIKKASQDWERFSFKLLKPTIIVITGIGAVTGIGIWFVLSALASRGIASMLRVFFYPWFAEWVVFTIEVILILVYYFTWDRWTGRSKWSHFYLAVSYVFAACVSAFLITAILGFMITPDGWPWNRGFWSAFLNPSFPAQLAVRLSLAFSLGALFAITYLLFSRHERDFRREAMRVFGMILFPFLVAWGLSAWWYFTVVPSTYKTHAVFSMLTSHFSQIPWLFWGLNYLGAAVLIVFSFVAMSRWTAVARPMSIIALLFALGFVGEFERIREFIRGPYLMPGYMYANQILLSEVPRFTSRGMLDNSFLYDRAVEKQDLFTQGTYLFGRNCSMCHTIGGLNDITERLRGRSEDGIFVLLGNTEKMVPFMPPFSGTVRERRIVADFLHRLTTGEIRLEAPSRYIRPVGEGSSR